MKPAGLFIWKERSQEPMFSMIPQWAGSTVMKLSPMYGHRFDNNIIQIIQKM
jgi:hypothetical protein